MFKYKNKNPKWVEYATNSLKRNQKTRGQSSVVYF